MIKRASSSEVFDIYAGIMISKRANFLTFLKEISEAAPKIENVVLEAPKLAAAKSALGGSSHVAVGLEGLSKLGGAEVNTIFKNLHSAGSVDDGAREILKVADSHGYKFDKIDDFLSKYGDDFKRMSEELETKFGPGTSQTEAEMIAFARKHSKTISFFNEAKLGKNGQLGKALEPSMISAGEFAIDNGRVGQSLNDLQSAAKGTSVIEKAKAVGGILRNTFQLLTVVGLGYAGYKFYNWINSDAGKEATDKNIEAMQTAIGCIEDLPIKAGSAAAAERSIIVQNLKDATDISKIANATDQKEIQDIYFKYSSAVELLSGSGSGSIANFVALISKEPSKNLDGYFAGNDFNSAAAGTAAGAVVGAGIGALFKSTLVGSAIGGVIGGFAGWFFVGNYYDDKLACLANAVDAAKEYDSKLSAAMQGAKSEETSAGTSGSSSTSGSFSGSSSGGSSGATSSGYSSGAYTSSSGSQTQRGDSGFSSDDISIVERILNAGVQEKLTGFSGIDLAREKKVIRSFVGACYGSKNAADIILKRNPSIIRYIDQLRQAAPALLSSPIDNNFQKNKSAESLIQVIYDSVRVLHKSVIRGNKTLGIINPGEEELTNLMRSWLGKEGYIFVDNKSAKNNWNKMNKTSKSINNQEFIRKAAETRVSYFGDANLGLKDQLTKSYYAGLTGMYNEQPKKRSSDYGDLYSLTDENLTLEAHPKSVTLAESMGKGGLVENGLEQKEKSTYVALTTPSGNFQSKYASTIGYLNKLAKAADDQGKKEVSKLIKQTIQNLK
jgi:hypothetical protein